MVEEHEKKDVAQIDAEGAVGQARHPAGAEAAKPLQKDLIQRTELHF